MSNSFDPHQFADRKQNPVSAHITSDGWVSTGISFEDYNRCQVRVKKTAGERRLPTPEWAMNNYKLRRVIVTFMEERAFSKKEREKIKGSLKNRLEKAKTKILSRRPKMLDVMKKLCLEYVEIKTKGLNPEISDRDWNLSKKQPYMEFAEGEARYVDEMKRRRQLEIEIEGIDTYLRYTEHGGADVVAAIVYFYYRVGLDSVGVGAELGLKPPHIRQTLWRLHRAAERALEPSQGSESGEASSKKRGSKNPRSGASAPSSSASKKKLYTPPIL